MLTEDLPVGGYEWMTPDEIDRVDWRTLDTRRADTGYVLMVDLDYDPAAFVRHETFPLAPESIPITEEMLSPLSLSYLDSFGQRGTLNSTRLTSHFLPRTKYVVHCRNLAYYLRNGMRLVRVHHAIRFRQAPFLNSFMKFISDKKAATNDPFQRKLLKLYLNSVYGKFILNKLRFVECSVISTDGDRVRKLASRPNFESFRLLNESSALIFRKPGKVVLDTMVAIGFSILDLSKLYVASQVHDEIIPRLGGPDRCSVIYTGKAFIFICICQKHNNYFFSSRH